MSYEFWVVGETIGLPIANAGQWSDSQLKTQNSYLKTLLCL